MIVLNDKIFYQQDKECPVCKKRFTITKVRNSHCPVKKRDEDFCLHYETINPNIYTVWICPFCGYAAPESIFFELSPEESETIFLALKGKEIKLDFSGERTIEVAIASYKLAIYCCQLRGYKNSLLAGLYLKIAWLYRELGDKREKDYLSRALDYYKLAYDEEPFPIGNLTELAFRYLIGELYRRIGEFREAIGWFNRVVSDRNGRLEPKIVNMAREQWGLAKEELNNQSLAEEIPNLTAATQEEKAGEKELATHKPNKKNKSSRIKVSSKVSFYNDQMEWVKKAVISTNDKNLCLDSQSVIRAILDLVLEINPQEIKCVSEEELTQLLKEKLKENSF